MLLQNEYIQLRAIEPEDLELMYQWENNSLYWHGGDTRSPYSRHILKLFIDEAGKDIYENKQLRLIISLKETQQAIGVIDLYEFDVFNSRLAVGLFIDEGHQKKGYAAMSLSIIEHYVIDYLKINQLFAYVSQTNTSSQKLFESRNFQKNGTLKQWLREGDDFSDVYVYQLLNQR